MRGRVYPWTWERNKKTSYGGHFKNSNFILNKLGYMWKIKISIVDGDFNETH